MFGPDYTAGCPNCSAIADGFNGCAAHLANHDVMLWAVSRAPLAKLQAYKRRMGWSFPWASSSGSDFNYDFNVSFSEEQQRSGNIEYNYRKSGVSSRKDAVAESEAAPDSGAAKLAAGVGVDWANFIREAPGMSAFALEDGVVYHLLGLRARLGRVVGCLPVARPRAQRTQRDGSLVSPSRRIRQRRVKRLLRLKARQSYGGPTAS